MPSTKCIHTTIRPLSSDIEYIDDGDIELCLDEHGYLVFDFKDHDGSGLVIAPDQVDKLRNFLGANDALQTP